MIVPLNSLVFKKKSTNVFNVRENMSIETKLYTCEIYAYDI